MKASKRYLVKTENIHSLKDLELEKQRLRLEILKTETAIQSNYRNITQALTFKNIAKAVSFGKLFLEKRKKKKHDKLKAAHDAQIP
jgi:hypothetical protein